MLEKLESEMPERIRALPRDPRGYPIPFFVQWFDGRPDFRVMSPERYQAAVTRNCCWTCGQKLGRNLAFVGGPLVAAQQASAEPSSHLECAIFAAKACPFLAFPKAKRREAAMPKEVANLPGIQIAENPGVTAVYVTRSAQLMDQMFRLGAPERVYWFHAGREATVDEVVAARNQAIERFLNEAGRTVQAIRHADILSKRLASLLPAAQNTPPKPF
jgi:hypothetical protein